MADLASMALSVTVTAVPFFIGASLVGLGVFRRNQQATLALGLGMSFYFLFDAFIDSTELGVTRGATGAALQVTLVAAFAATFLLLVLSREGPELTWPLWALAIGISIHSFSEANGLASAAPLYLSNFGSILPDAASFIVHKFFEGLILASAAFALGITSVKRVIIMGSPMFVSVVGGALSSAIPLDLTPFVAAGAGGWFTVTIALSPRLKSSNGTATHLIFLLGFLSVYAATLLHVAGNALG